MPQTQTRQVGSGFTAFRYMGQAIAFLDEVGDSGQKPIVRYEAVTPLDWPHPAEFATTRVLAEGTLTLTVRELWNFQAWEQVAFGLAGTDNIIDIFNAQAAQGAITAATIIRSPSGFVRGHVYNNVTIVDIDDREQVAIGTLTFPRNLTMVYTHKVPYRGG